MGRIGGRSLTQPPLVEVHLHAETGAQEPDPSKAAISDPLRGRVRDVYQGDVDVFLNLIRHHVQGVGANEQQIGASELYGLSAFDQSVRRDVPSSDMLQRFYLLKIEGEHDAASGMQPPSRRATSSLMIL
jgi:hypothetical protein